MSPPRRPALLLLVLALAAPAARAADGGQWRLGLNGSYGSQRLPPFGNKNYLHDLAGYGLLLNRGLWAAGSLDVELQLEPTVYTIRHRMLNRYFYGPTHGADYLAQRARWLRGENYQELALNLGLLARWRVTRALSLFVLGGVGPMWSFGGTERLARGYAFSDVVAVGVGIRIRCALLEVRPGLRHESNLQTQIPNSGHNQVTLDAAVSFDL